MNILTVKGKRIHRVTLRDDILAGLLITFERWSGSWIPVIEQVEDSDFTEGEFIEGPGGGLYCRACGMLAAPGDEEFDWCDHITGEGCSYFPEEDDCGD